jgi:hypothetical protein
MMKTIQEDKNKFMCGNDTYGKCFRSLHIDNELGATNPNAKDPKLAKIGLQYD